MKQDLNIVSFAVSYNMNSNTNKTDMSCTVYHTSVESPILTFTDKTNIKSSASGCIAETLTASRRGPGLTPIRVINKSSRLPYRCYNMKDFLIIQSVLGNRGPATNFEQLRVHTTCTIFGSNAIKKKNWETWSTVLLSDVFNHCQWRYETNIDFSY